MLTVLNKKHTSSIAAFFILATLLLSGCASQEVNESDELIIEADPQLIEEQKAQKADVVETQVKVEVVEEDEPEASEEDPYEGFNRSMYDFNEVLDDYLAEPISDAYLWVTPQFVQTGVGNFFSNLKDINVVLNDMMQGKVAQGGSDTGRFAINSTIGLLGLFDVATDLGFEKHDEDFAQTLAVWGVPQGPYLVLPVLGPATTRGIPGGIFDRAANPATYIPFPIEIIEMVNTRANADGSLKMIDEAALDPYVFTREAFLQHRKYLITDGESEGDDDLLDLEDDFYDEDELSVEPSNQEIQATDVKQGDEASEITQINEDIKLNSDVSIEAEQVSKKDEIEVIENSSHKIADKASESIEDEVQTTDDATTRRNVF